MIAEKENLGVTVELEQIIGFLKRNSQLKEVHLRILSQTIINKAARERGLIVAPEEIQAEANRQRYEKRLEKASDTLAWLNEQMMAPEDWEAGICDRILSNKLADFLFGKEVEKFFAQNRINFDEAIVYQIIVSNDKLAQELFYEIAEQEISFYDAARLYDIDEKRRHQCGFEGRLSRWHLKPDIAAAVFGAQPGEVIGPIKTGLGYHLFMVEKFVRAELTPQRYQEIRDRMFQEWLDSEINYLRYS
ncbi:MAG TPA: peptidylprolyl isomerase [Cyanobacteria bacterium UBA11149]|nr:peptidylprolyl isomerase [Cyanobacteria bacterium UBA11367]HBE58318.1 peptidylprolyl isomerase [Cyanobacteria bacterium UBA11366]HBK62653.1 peptidylprolyl isomerase [Cyanobacteria bacterium UBA11166]HBR76293.1 peptidylprolyl isomerase [Cyanobacteria bacterium UBA11159]HBS72514.1 peptidylprolyl isomerase [Cyanobacteria bacterium UBA11153]HBW89111.1 peptidylprolyl isomerase [Cyanobacteria bacterium UBA11149]